MAEVERWRAVSGVPDGLGTHYEVSSIGRVRSRGRRVRGSKGERLVRGRVMVTSPNPRGYETVNLCMEGRSRRFRVHRLVAMAFIGQPDASNLHACHNNGRRTDNRAENLRWDTAKGNQADAIAHGTQPRGERIGTSKLSEAEAIAVLTGAGTEREIAMRAGVSVTTVSNIRRGITWKHLPREAAP